MTNTNTEDTSQTINQINQLQEAGADIVRVSLPTEAAADSFKIIKENTSIPLVTDILTTRSH